jgi:tetratricopeptide (TPR) repeat protein
LLAKAIQYHQQGSLDEAARLYEVLLAGNPAHADALHLRGLIALQQGDASLADDLIGRAIAAMPGVAVYHANRAEAWRILGQIERAVGGFETALALQPSFPAALNNLGLCLQALGKTEAAATRFRKALQIQPGFAMAHNNLAMALHRQGNKAEALAHFHRCVELEPTLAEAHSNLGQLLLELRRPDEALVHCQEAVRLRPAFPEGQQNLGRVLRELGRLAEAKTCYAEALKLDPDRPVACNDMGQILHDEGKLEQSLAWYDRSLSLDPNFALAHCDRGVVLEELGDLHAAERAFRAAIAGGQGPVEAYYQLATLIQGGLPAADLDAMRRLAAEPGLSDDARSTLHSGIALVLDAQGDYTCAAEHLGLANALGLADARSRGRAYDPAEHDRLVASVIAACTPAFFERVRDFGVESERPIFVMGLPRTGTTLTEQILASHWQVFGAGELTVARESFESLPGLMNRADPAPFCLGRLDRATAGQLARQHLERLAALNSRARRVVDKMPENYLYLGMLAALFPRARFIYCRRDRRDVAVSCWMTHFRNIGWANDPAHIAHRIGACERIMEHWSRVLPGRCLDVPYEETVADLERVARRLVDWCGLDWDPACLSFHEGRRPVRSASLAQVRRPLYTHAVGRWKNYEQALAPLLALLPSAPARP